MTNVSPGLRGVRVLAFDVFGTVVDWHGSIVREIEAVAQNVNGEDFARAWRAGYKPAMEKVTRGELPWTLLDDLHRMILDDVIQRFDLRHLTEDQISHLNLAWHRLEPWPDTVDGLERLKESYIISTLSNGNIGLLTNMAKRAGLPWDCILCAEVFRKYKPDPVTYLSVADVFNLDARQVLMVAAHHDDLAAARKCGLKTAYVERPYEFGRDQPKDVSPRDGNDLHARSFIHLAELLGC